LNWWVAPTKKQCKTGYRIIKSLAGRAGVLRSYKDGDLNIVLVNGTEIDFRSWEVEENLSGESIYACVVDEAGQLTPLARSIISTRRSAKLGPIRYIGNATIELSELWRLARQAQSDAHPSIHFMKWTWKHRARALTGAARRAYIRFIIDEYKNMSREDFRRLYCAEFLQLGTGVLDFRPISVNGGSEDEPVKLPFMEPWDFEVDGRCVAGLDLGQKQDWTVVTVWGRKSGRLKAMGRYRHARWEVQVERVFTMLEKYCIAKTDHEAGVRRQSLQVFYDANSIGGPVGELLQKRSIGTGVVVHGVHFSSESKQEMISATQLEIEQATISAPFIKELVNEADTLERTVLSSSIRYRHAKGFNDDTIWSAGLALHAKRRIISGVPV
jgi:hypothetical protein